MDIWEHFLCIPFVHTWMHEIELDMWAGIVIELPKKWSQSIFCGANYSWETSSQRRHFSIPKWLHFASLGDPDFFRNKISLKITFQFSTVCCAYETQRISSSDHHSKALRDSSSREETTTKLRFRRAQQQPAAALLIHSLESFSVLQRVSASEKVCCFKSWVHQSATHHDICGFTIVIHVGISVSR